MPEVHDLPDRLVGEGVDDGTPSPVLDRQVTREPQVRSVEADEPVGLFTAMFLAGPGPLTTTASNWLGCIDAPPFSFTTLTSHLRRRADKPVTLALTTVACDDASFTTHCR